jgi:hypothetical protein
VEGEQLLDQFSGLYAIGTYNCKPVYVLLKFKGQDAMPPHSVFAAKVKGVGAYKYVNGIGTLEIVPELEVMAVKNHNARNLYWHTQY